MTKIGPTLFYMLTNIKFQVTDPLKQIDIVKKIIFFVFSKFMYKKRPKIVQQGTVKKSLKKKKSIKRKNNESVTQNFNPAKSSQSLKAVSSIIKNINYFYENQYCEKHGFEKNVFLFKKLLIFGQSSIHSIFFIGKAQNNCFITVLECYKAFSYVTVSNRD